MSPKPPFQYVGSYHVHMYYSIAMQDALEPHFEAIHYLSGSETCVAQAEVYNIVPMGRCRSLLAP